MKTSHFDIEVLGTAFNVHAYKDDVKSSVVLLRGIVNVKGEHGDKMNLVPNELASIRNGVILGKERVNAEEYTVSYTHLDVYKRQHCRWVTVLYRMQ